MEKCFCHVKTIDVDGNEIVLAVKDSAARKAIEDLENNVDGLTVDVEELTDAVNTLENTVENLPAGGSGDTTVINITGYSDAYTYAKEKAELYLFEDTVTDIFTNLRNQNKIAHLVLEYDPYEDGSQLTTMIIPIPPTGVDQENIIAAISPNGEVLQFVFYGDSKDGYTLSRYNGGDIDGEWFTEFCYDFEKEGSRCGRIYLQY